MKDEKSENESVQEDGLRFSLKFTVQIYEINKKNQTHMVDVCLSQGHPLNFFPFTCRFYEVLENCLFI